MPHRTGDARGAVHRPIIERVTVTLTSQDPARLAVDALVVAVAQRTARPSSWAPTACPKELRDARCADAAALGITGAADEVRRLPGTGLAAPVARPHRRRPGRR